MHSVECPLVNVLTLPEDEHRFYHLGESHRLSAHGQRSLLGNGFSSGTQWCRRSTRWSVGVTVHHSCWSIAQLIINNKRICDNNADPRLPVYTWQVEDFMTHHKIKRSPKRRLAAWDLVPGLHNACRGIWRRKKVVGGHKSSRLIEIVSVWLSDSTTSTGTSLMDVNGGFSPPY